MGGSRITVPYIKETRNNKKLYDDREKEQEFRRIWENIFRITPEENTKFDANKEREVNAY